MIHYTRLPLVLQAFEMCGGVIPAKQQKSARHKQFHTHLSSAHKDISGKSLRGGLHLQGKKGIW